MRSKQYVVVTNCHTAENVHENNSNGFCFIAIISVKAHCSKPPSNFGFSSSLILCEVNMKNEGGARLKTLNPKNNSKLKTQNSNLRPQNSKLKAHYFILNFPITPAVSTWAIQSASARKSVSSTWVAIAACTTRATAAS